MHKIRLVLLTTILTSLLFAFFPLKIALSATDHIVISEIQISGGPGNTTNDFIELYNPTGSDFDLNGYRLVKRTADGTTDSSIKSWASETIIPVSGYYLWANSDWTPPVTPDATTSATIADNNGVALRQGPENTGTIIDSVAWGVVTNAFVETTAADSPPDNGSIERIPVDEDTNNNSVDFVVRDVSDPQNSESIATPTPTPSESPTPSPEPTESPTPTPTETPSPSPTESPSPTPTLTPSPTPTPAPQMFVIGRFSFPGRLTICYLEYHTVKIGFLNVNFPTINCVGD
jgi:predicted extracellular nuclease